MIQYVIVGLIIICAVGYALKRAYDTLNGKDKCKGCSGCCLHCDINKAIES